MCRPRVDVVEDSELDEKREHWEDEKNEIKKNKHQEN